MSQFIIEMGSGNSCKNDLQIVEDMIDTVVDCDTGLHEVVFKWQLFKDVPPNVPLDREVFEYAYHYAEAGGCSFAAAKTEINWEHVAEDACGCYCEPCE